jgi:hypothetical protein
MDIFNMNFTGNLTGDAVKSEYTDKERKVYNFTVACNVTENKTLFLEVAYWVKLKKDNATEQEDKLLTKLTKGKSVTVVSNYASLDISESPKDNTKYQNFQVTASRLKL